MAGNIIATIVLVILMVGSVIVAFVGTLGGAMASSPNAHTDKFVGRLLISCAVAFCVSVYLLFKVW